MRWHDVLFAVAALAIAIPAQQEAEIAAAVRLPDLRIPIHTRTNSPVAPYGIWAAGPRYKASFHDGFAFYPYLGHNGAGNTPLRWHTTSVRVGDAELVDTDAPPQTRFTDWRCEFVHPAFVEAYDVRPDGVEQSFEVQDPGVRGDLIITGKLDTPLVSDRVAARHGAVDFRSDLGEVIVCYGAATALDAGGRHVEVKTSFEDGAIRLHLDGAWLRDAQFPVTVDPLVGTTTIISLGQGPVARPEIYCVRTATQQNVLMIQTRLWALSDHDCFAWTFDSDFQNGKLIYYDINADFSNFDCAVAFNGQTQKWILVHDFQTNGLLAGSAIWYYVHDLGNTTALSGTSGSWGTAHFDESVRRPDVGGTEDVSPAGPYALIVYEHHSRTAPKIDLIAYRIDTSGGSPLEWPIEVTDAPITADQQRMYPTLSSMCSGNAGSWLVVWQERDTVYAPNWRLRGSQIQHGGYRSGTAELGPTVVGKQVIRPRVQGLHGRYLLSCAVGTDAVGDYGQSIYTERLDWPTGITPLVKPYPPRLLANVPSNQYKNSELAYDHRDQSHWVLAWQRFAGSGARAEVARVGYSGDAVEWQSIGTTTFNPAVGFMFDDQTFPVIYGSSDTSNPMWRTFFTYDPTAAATPYGTGCAGRIFAPTPPYAGSQFFSVDLAGTLPGKSAWLLLSPASAALSLTPIQMPNCWLNVATADFALPTTTTASGRASIPIRLPDRPLVLGDLFFQWLYLDPSTPLGLVSTKGLQVHIQ